MFLALWHYGTKALRHYGTTALRHRLPSDWWVRGSLPIYGFGAPPTSQPPQLDTLSLSAGLLPLQCRQPTTIRNFLIWFRNTWSNREYRK